MIESLVHKLHPMFFSLKNQSLDCSQDVIDDHDKMKAEGMFSIWVNNYNMGRTLIYQSFSLTREKSVNRY